jgi:hypothetical protein
MHKRRPGSHIPNVHLDMMNTSIRAQDVVPISNRLRWSDNPEANMLMLSMHMIHSNTRDERLLIPPLGAITIVHSPSPLDPGPLHTRPKS